jgi:hypothetical protein
MRVRLVTLLGFQLSRIVNTLMSAALYAKLVQNLVSTRRDVPTVTSPICHSRLSLPS